jgi:hypothetical protein
MQEASLNAAIKEAVPGLLMDAALSTTTTSALIVAICCVSGTGSITSAKRAGEYLDPLPAPLSHREAEGWRPLQQEVRLPVPERRPSSSSLTQAMSPAGPRTSAKRAGEYLDPLPAPLSHREAEGAEGPR